MYMFSQFKVEMGLWWLKFFFSFSNNISVFLGKCGNVSFTIIVLLQMNEIAFKGSGDTFTALKQINNKKRQQHQHFYNQIRGAGLQI